MFEVQTLTALGWVNCWHYNDKPQTFPSREAAQAAIDELIADVAHAVSIGNMPGEFSADEYRVVPVTT